MSEQMEWDASCLGKREPLLVVVTWVDAAADPSFTCGFKEVGEKATLQLNRKSDGRFIYVNASTNLHHARVVLSNMYDPETPTHEAMVENFMAIPLGWVDSIKTAKGRVIYKRVAPC